MTEQKKIDKHPPASTRCQIYVKPIGVHMNELVRCTNEGTHWVQWGGCGCADADPEVCEEDFYSWECDGPCSPVAGAEAAA